ncbi:PREDICTED: kirola-like [Populus euphratica]|uniref:Kirola-like n=1 Tax=Populus euphratica TaxID=75702 RepID=A0AAJ6XR31_POPEU|nr:PREDICTED: kirola-like [Populus euphratica]
MAQIGKEEVKKPIQCSEVKFYDVYRNEAYLLPTISPCNVKKIKLGDGTSSWESKVGSRKLVHFDEAGLEDFKDEVVEIHPKAKKITYKVLEGNMMLFYHSFQATLEVTEGTAKWTVEFKKKNHSCPDPDYYLHRLDSVNKDVNAYLLPIN